MKYLNPLQLDALTKSCFCTNMFSTEDLKTSNQPSQDNHTPMDPCSICLTNLLSLFLGDLNCYNFNYVDASTPKVGDWAERWDSR